MWMEAVMQGATTLIIPHSGIAMLLIGVSASLGLSVGYIIGRRR